MPKTRPVLGHLHITLGQLETVGHLSSPPDLIVMVNTLLCVSETLICDVQKQRTDVSLLSGPCLFIQILVILFSILLPVWFVPLLFCFSLFCLVLIVVSMCLALLCVWTWTSFAAHHLMSDVLKHVISFAAFLLSVFRLYICCSSCVFCVCTSQFLFLHETFLVYHLVILTLFSFFIFGSFLIIFISF